MWADATGSSAAGDLARQALCRAFRREAPHLHRLALRYHGRADAADLKAGVAPKDACAVNVEAWAPCDACEPDRPDPAERRRAARETRAFEARRASLHRLFPARPTSMPGSAIAEPRLRSPLGTAVHCGIGPGPPDAGGGPAVKFDVICAVEAGYSGVADDRGLRRIS